MISERTKNTLLNIICFLVGTMMLYRGVINLTQYPGYWLRILLGIVFLGGAYGIFLIFRRRALGFWLFTGLNFLVAYWFIYILEDIWQHHVLPHIIFSAVFIPFYKDFKAGVEMKILLKIIRLFPGGKRLASNIATKVLAGSTSHRPHTFSLWHPLGGEKETSDYMSWHTVTDKNYFDLHLGPADQSFISNLPSNEPPSGAKYGEITELFKRKQFKPSRSSVFFMFFAQWFTDGFFRSSHVNPRRTTSNQNIDLAQIYGADEEIALSLRLRKDGKLRFQIISNEVYPDSLGEKDANGKWQVKDRYKVLPYIKDEKWMDDLFGALSDDQKSYLMATGLERGNLTLGNIVMTTLFLREHNDICDSLKAEYEHWDDDRLFHTARLINTAILMKLVVEEYVNHIAGVNVLLFTPEIAEKQNWYREPWIGAEFNLLYRWHGLVPDRFSIGGKDVSFVRNFDLLPAEGLAKLIDAASTQQAGEISLENTPDFLLRAERATIDKGREWRLRSFNDYREAFGLDRLSSFSQLTGDDALAEKLEKIYKSIDQLEFVVGLFAESDKISLNGELQRTMVAYDAITQIYTNPILAKKNFTEEHFTEIGYKRIRNTDSFQTLVNRHVKAKAQFGID